MGTLPLLSPRTAIIFGIWVVGIGREAYRRFFECWDRRRFGISAVLLATVYATTVSDTLQVLLDPTRKIVITVDCLGFVELLRNEARSEWWGGMEGLSPDPKGYEDDSAEQSPLRLGGAAGGRHG